MFGSTKKEVIPNPKEWNSSNNIIGKGTNLEGNLNTPGNLRIEGRVKGNIQTKTKVVLGETSAVEGGITAQTAEIGGEVQGTIKVSGLLTLKGSAVINGDIIANKLVFEAGARFNGKCSMGSMLEDKKATQPTPNSQHAKSVEAVLQQATRSQKGS